MTRATLTKDPAEVAAMFDEVAARYDLTNAVLSLGQARGWRRAVTRALHLQPGEVVLDLAAGTATSSAALAASGAQVVGCDFSLGMLQVGRRRVASARGPRGGGSTTPARPPVELVAGDALRLPFRDGSFDAVTIAFGLRNTSDLHVALQELRRVTRPGGRLVVCEFSHPTWAPLRTAYVEYLLRALPPVAARISSDPEAYQYLAESIRAWPAQAELAGRVQQAGWGSVGWQDLTGGIVALHRGVR